MAFAPLQNAKNGGRIRLFRALTITNWGGESYFILNYFKQFEKKLRFHVKIFFESLFRQKPIVSILFTTKKKTSKDQKSSLH